MWKNSSVESVMISNRYVGTIASRQCINNVGCELQSKGNGNDFVNLFAAEPVFILSFVILQ